jgi:hypothetical protein
LINNQEKEEDGSPLNILERMKDNLELKKSTLFYNLKKMVESETLIIREEERNMKNNNPMVLIRYFVNPERFKSIRLAVDDFLARDA